MHPLILQQLATHRVNDMIATAADSRRAREARRTRRARTSGQRSSGSAADRAIAWWVMRAGPVGSFGCRRRPLGGLGRRPGRWPRL